MLAARPDLNLPILVFSVFTPQSYPPLSPYFLEPLFLLRQPPGLSPKLLSLGPVTVQASGWRARPEV